MQKLIESFNNKKWWTKSLRPSDAREHRNLFEIRFQLLATQPRGVFSMKFLKFQKFVYKQKHTSTHCWLNSVTLVCEDWRLLNSFSKTKNQFCSKNPISNLIQPNRVHLTESFLKPIEKITLLMTKSDLSIRDAN